MRNLTASFLLAIGCIVMVSGCSNSQGDEHFTEQVENKSPEGLYQDARTAMELGNFTKATQILETLDSRYPFGAHKTQVQLDLIFSYYKLEDSANALANIDRFVRLNPTHKDIDYVYYMRGLTNMQSDEYMFHEMVGIDRSDRDPSAAMEAFRDFEKLLKTFPNSRYSPDAQQRMIMLKNRLARFHLQVAEYYVSVDTWVAAANRAQQIMETFGDTPSAERALEIMVISYEKLKQDTLMANAKNVLATNFPDNRYAQ
ncbi:outer membrane protein assembly factor BamD [Ferrimonas lipolytica]|uniref:Outer membrane protein assembly factor BamD n=1 Tax=Ferrimonas lipolytica TaxID=2724191 RepID=A0A6H1U8S0_9GAMM|nr:outer membrane protein assembly factor BamD [Ferrimonas lipolytica]QIZ75437.1 outer membrane protein assembly factor BamD [Ferrimonas lipolytica]